MEGGGALGGDFLPDHIGHTRIQLFPHLLRCQVPAGIGGTVKLTAVLLGLGFLAEAVIGGTLFHQEPGVFAVGIPPLGLDIGGYRAAQIGSFVVGQAALGHGAVDHIHGAFHLPGLVGVLNAQDEGASVGAGDEPGVQCRTQITHMHIAGGGGGKSGTHLTVGDLGLHLLEIAVIQCHSVKPP